MDDKTPIIFTWIDQETGSKFHVFPHNIAIVELLVECPEEPEGLEERVQKLCADILTEAYQHFSAFIFENVNKLNDSVLDKLIIDHQASLKIYWITRSLIFSKSELNAPNNKTLITDWLENTQCPEDAQRIMDGDVSYSMTWLNYVLIDYLPESDYRVEAMVLAQYFYTTQESCNDMLRDSIESSYIGSSAIKAEQKLESSRVVTRMHLIAYHDYMKFFNRTKKKLLLEILGSWEFESLVDNSYRMIEVSTSKLKEVDTKRKDRSNVLTDMLLVALSFFAVFELSLYLVEFSREMLSRPTLDYNDESSSTFLGLIATIDTDYMFASGIILTIFLILFYRYIKYK